MKKRIAFALCMILMVLMLGACGTDPTTVDYNGKSYSDLQSEMDTNAGMVQSLAQLFKENKLTADTLPDDVKDQLTSSYGVTEAQIEAAAKWQDTLDEFGEMKKIEDDTFEVTKSGKTLTTDMTIKFAKKDVNFEVVYDYYSMDVTGISVDPIYTLGEKMEKAGLNTVISMAVVFAVLILISLLIFPALRSSLIWRKRKLPKQPDRLHSRKRHQPQYRHLAPVRSHRQMTLNLSQLLQRQSLQAPELLPVIS